MQKKVYRVCCMETKYAGDKRKEDKNKFYSETKLKYYRRKAMNKKFGRKR